MLPEDLKAYFRLEARWQAVCCRFSRVILSKILMLIFRIVELKLPIHENPPAGENRSQKESGGIQDCMMAVLSSESPQSCIPPLSFWRPGLSPSPNLG